MAERNMRVKVGGFVLAMLAALTVLILLFGGAPRFLANSTKLTVLFPEAPGVLVGTPVRKSGVRIGQVTGIEIDDDTGQVRVKVEVDNKYLPRQSEEPVIARGLLNGDTNIDFVPRTAKEGVTLVKAERYAAGTEIPGVAPISPAKLFTQAQGTIPDAQGAIQQFTATVAKFEGVGPKAEKALDEFASVARGIKDFLPELRETNRRVQAFLGEPDRPGEKPEPPATLKQLLKEVQDFVKAYKPLAEDVRSLIKNNEKELTESLKSLRQLTTRAGDFLSEDNRKALTNALKTIETAAADILSKQNKDSIAAILKNVGEASGDIAKTVRLVGILADSLDGTVKELNNRLVDAKTLFENLNRASKPIADNAEPVMKNLASAADNLSRTLAEVRQTIALLNKADGTLSRVLTDPQVYNNVAEATAALTRTMHRAEKIAKDLEVFADKVARRPETIGLGGVVRPNTGLKESPFAPLPSFPVPGTNPGVVNPGVPAVLPQPGGPLTPFPPSSSFRGPDAALQPPELPPAKLVPFAPMR
jgi:phospholipid/cholesterol/gamma-HCH transport system substrate-binding protein